MSWKRLLLRVAIVLAAAIGVWIYEKQVAPPAAPPPVVTQQAKPATPAPAAAVLPPAAPSRIAMKPPVPGELSQVSPHPMATAIGSAGIPPEKEIQLVLDLFQTYRREFGSFPAGETNAHFMNALRGSNPTKLPIFPQTHPRLDPSGNLLDPWSQPYLIHQVSRDRLEIRSKGPDNEIFTTDDLVVPLSK